MLPAEAYPAIGLFLSIVGSVWFLAWWLSGKFSEMKVIIFSENATTRKELTKKIEYHERHDDSRFDQLVNELWSIKMRNAARDGIPVEPVYRPLFRKTSEVEQEKDTHPIIRRKIGSEEDC